MEPMLMIANAAARGGERRGVEAALEILRAHGDVEVCETSNPGELDGVLHRAGSRRILVAGGDGSLHAVVAALYRRHDLAGAVLGLLPLGTGNDFARGVDLPLDPREAARALVEGEPRPMDLIVDELGGVVVNNVHLGASAEASRHGATWKRRLGKVGLGILGYPIGAAVAAVRPPFVRLRVEVDGEVVADVDRHVLMVAVGNGASVGGGTEITPEADPEDGTVDVMVSFATGPLQRFGFARQLAGGDHADRTDVVYRRAHEVSVSGEDFWLSADGELSGPERRRAWRVEKAAYSLLLPPADDSTEPSAAEGS